MVIDEFAFGNLTILFIKKELWTGVPFPRGKLQNLYSIHTFLSDKVYLDWFISIIPEILYLFNHLDVCWKIWKWVLMDSQDWSDPLLEPIWSISKIPKHTSRIFSKNKTAERPVLIDISKSYVHISNISNVL